MAVEKRDRALEVIVTELLRLRREDPLNYKLVVQMFREMCPPGGVR